MFGPYVVYNENQYQIKFMGIKDNSGTKELTDLFTTTAASVPSIAYLGSHEYYWWPYKNFLMARLGDGSTFKFFRFANDFLTVSAATQSSLPVASRIEQVAHTLL